MGRCVPGWAVFVTAPVVVFLTICSYYAYTRHYRTVSGYAAGSPVDSAVATPELTAQWTRKKYIVPEGEIIATIPQVVIGGDTLLRDNPVCYPVRDLNGDRETPAVEFTVPLPVSTPLQTPK